METSYLLLGTNVGDRSQNLAKARLEISRKIGPIITASFIYKTAAWGKTNQADFYNQVVVISSTLTAYQALDCVIEIENNMGRVRTEKWGARIIDIDILFWGNLVINDPVLTIPHPQIPFRKFTLLPLIEINSELIHPVSKLTITELLELCTDDLPVEKI